MMLSSMETLIANLWLFIGLNEIKQRDCEWFIYICVCAFPDSTDLALEDIAVIAVRA